MGKMGEKQRRPPIAVLIDRSRDWDAAGGLIGLEPDDRYLTIDNRRPLTARRLAPHDVLVIAGHGFATQSRSEIEAIVRFVRRGGGLLLAATAGVFEQVTGRPLSEMAVQAVAAQFGIEFVSSSQATGQTRIELTGILGYPPGTVKMRRAAALRGVRRFDATLEQWSPVRSTPPSTVLLSHRRTREAAALALSFGKGRVVAVGCAGFLNGSSAVCLALIDYLAAHRRPRRGEPPAFQAPPALKTRRSGRFTVHYPESVASRVPQVLRTAGEIMPWVDALDLAKKNRPWRITLVPSCSSGPDWSSRGEDALGVRIGAWASPARLAFALGQSMAAMLMPAWSVVRFTVLGRGTLESHFGLRAMRFAGHVAEADHLAAALEPESRRQLRGLDLARYYGEWANPPGLWLWQELARRHGEDILARFIAAVPKNFDFPDTPGAPFGALDLAIHFLSRAAKTDLYPWFAELGATVHKLPPGRIKSKAYKLTLRRALRRIVGDRRAPASERTDAVWTLAGIERGPKHPLSGAARLLRSPRPAARLIGAIRLAAVRDRRCLRTLKELAAQREDPGLAAIAALSLVDQGERSAADRLVALARKLDHRFQLDAAHRLRMIEDRRADEFSLDGLRRAHGRKAACLKVEESGELKVWPVVDGHCVGNVFSGERMGHMPANTHVPLFFVHWVHTLPAYRRKGLIRQAFARAIQTARARGYAWVGLGTGTENVAHVLYRSFGLVDAPVWEELSCDLNNTPLRPRTRGLHVRPFRPGDEIEMARLFNQWVAETSAVRYRQPRALEANEVALFALRRRKRAAFATARVNGKSAYIGEFAWNPSDKPQELVTALATDLHRRLKKKGVEKVTTYCAPNFLAPLLEPSGYGNQRSHGLALIGILDLPRYLEAIRPLLERRLADEGWTGTLALCGENHRAALVIEKGRVTVLKQVPGRASIALRGSDDTITRIVTGIASPFEAYWTPELEIAPPLTDAVRGLLDKLFPKNKICAWAWG